MTDIEYSQDKILKKSKSELFKVFLITVFHTTSIILSSYITIILSSMNFSPQNISYCMAIIGFSFAPISIISGTLSDLYGRKFTFSLFKIITILCMIAVMIMNGNMISSVLLMIVICINNSLDPVLVSIGMDFTRENEKRSTFSIIQLGISVGMAIISIAASYFFDINITVFYSILIVLTIVPIFLINRLYKGFERKEVIKTKKKDSNEVKEKISFAQLISKNKVLIIFSVILIGFSIINSQRTYGLVYKLEDVYGDMVSRYVGILTFVYYFSIIIFNRFTIKFTKSFSCMGNIMIAGVLYIVSSALITFTGSFAVFVIAVGVWAIAQLMTNVNNSEFITNYSNKNSVGRYNAIFTIVSGSGTVLGPLLSGAILTNLGLLNMWKAMIIIGAISTVFMYVLYRVYEKGGNRYGKYRK